MNKLKEKNILSRLRKKDSDVFMKVYDLYVNDIYRFIYFKTGNKEDANDLTSITFLKAWNHIQNNSLKDNNTLRALFYRIARNAVIDFYRTKKESFSIDNEDNNSRELADEKEDITGDLDISLDFEKVEGKLSELKDEYREVIILRYVNELELHEIAKIIDKSKGNVRVLVFRALKALKTLMEEDEDKV